jgi:hypothetical protein
VELKRPEVRETKWKDKEDKEAEKGQPEELLKMEAKCNEDMEEGAVLTFRVYNDAKRDKPVHETTAENKGGTAEAEWAYHYDHNPEEPLTEKPKFFFTVNARRCREAKSGNVEISATCEIVVVDNLNKTMGNYPLKLAMNGTAEEVQTDAGGIYKKEGCVPGYAELEAVFDKEYKRPEAEKYKPGENDSTAVFYRDEEGKTVSVKNWEKITARIKEKEPDFSM